MNAVRQRLRFLAYLNPSKTTTREVSSDTEVVFVPMEAVSETGEIDTSTSKPLSAVYTGYTYFASGDVLVAKITPCFENGKGALVPDIPHGIGFGTTEFHVLRPTPSLDGRFLYYITRSTTFRERGAAEMKGAAGQQRVPEDFVKDFQVWLPPMRLQRAIARTLDRKTAAIDSLIEKKEKLIALLAEERAAHIQRAVTNGLNPDVQMKDSGIPWIGRIPAHWQVRRLKRISPSQSVGVVINPSLYVIPNGDIPFIYGSDVAAGHIDISEARRISHEDNRRLAKSKLKAGDVVVVRVGAPGVSAVVPHELDGINCASMMIVRGAPSFCSRWLEFAMNSSVGATNVELVAYGAAQKQFNISHAVDFVFPVPPLDEQIEIAEHLSAQEARHRELLRRLEGQIGRLLEYRQALITAAVIGQLDFGASFP